MPAIGHVPRAMAETRRSELPSWRSSIAEGSGFGVQVKCRIILTDHSQAGKLQGNHG